MAVTRRATRSQMRILDGMSLDVTYRCDNACRHCWLLPAPEAAADELSFAEVRDLVADARALGCRQWAFSGGEPLLRDDFLDILSLATERCLTCTVNTNGTLITPESARALARADVLLVSLYGADAAVHDDVTRVPGSFEAAIRGMRYLREAGTPFVAQLIPLRANAHQYPAMAALAASLTPHQRIGAEWLYLSAIGDPARNQEIAAQRLAPDEIAVMTGKPHAVRPHCAPAAEGEGPLARCATRRTQVHVSPGGAATFCPYIVDPALRYDLRRGSLREAWEHFIPSLAHAIPAEQGDCGACAKRGFCGWCPAYAYLEHREYMTKIDSLCDQAETRARDAADWARDHVVYFRVADITIEVRSDRPIDEGFRPALATFMVDEPGEDRVILHHHEFIPDIAGRDLGEVLYEHPPWIISRKGRRYIYRSYMNAPGREHPLRLIEWDEAHTDGHVYIWPDVLRGGPRMSLTRTPSDLILLARLLADRNGLLQHAAGMVIDGAGYAFIGHSSAGKSTTVTMLREDGEILCDDRIAIRAWPDGYRLYGTWSHGDVPDVSPASAPLRALCFISQADDTRAVRLTPQQALHGLLAHVIKPLATAEWWTRTIDIAHALAHAVPAYQLSRNLSGDVRQVIRELG